MADIALNQVGRIKEVSHQGGIESREYGLLGEVVRETKTLTVAAPGGGPVPTYTTEYDFDTFGRLMTLTLPDGETLHHVYDNGGLLKQITGRYDGADYDYLENLEYDKFGQRRFMALGNGVKTLYRYDDESRRLCNLQSGTGIGSDNDTACPALALPESQDGEAAKEALSVLIASAQGGGAAQFQNLRYAYDPLGNILGIGNSVKLTSNRELGGPVLQSFA